MAGFDWRRAQNMEISPLCDIAQFCNIDNDGGNAGNNDGDGNNDGGRAGIVATAAGALSVCAAVKLFCVVTAATKTFNKHFTFTVQEN